MDTRDNEFAMLLSKAIGAFAPLLTIHPEAVSAKRVHDELTAYRDGIVSAAIAKAGAQS